MRIIIIITITFFIFFFFNFHSENISKRFQISRHDQDDFAFNSHRKASKAKKSQQFLSEIISVGGVLEDDGKRTFNCDCFLLSLFICFFLSFFLCYQSLFLSFVSSYPIVYLSLNADIFFCFFLIYLPSLCSFPHFLAFFLHLLLSSSRIHPLLS